MASPQLENGYTRIADELMEALAKWHLSNYEMRVLMFIVRKTYGFGKSKDWISLSQFVDGTGISQPHICRSIRMLINQNLITKGGKKGAPFYMIQKDHEKWQKIAGRSHHLPKGALPKGAIGITKGGNQGVPKGAHTIDTLTKDTLSKDKGAKPRKYEDGTELILLKDEVMSQIDDRDRSFPRKRVFGDEKVDWILDYSEHLLQRKLGGKEKWNRIYARHLWKKYGMTQIKSLLEYVCAPESWWFDKLSQMGTLYKHSERLFAEMTAKPKVENKIKFIS